MLEEYSKDYHLALCQDKDYLRRDVSVSYFVASCFKRCLVVIDLVDWVEVTHCVPRNHLKGSTCLVSPHTKH